MSSVIATTPTSAHVTSWDRGVVIALGAAGCALSYDALQQMAVAIHVRGFLTFIFPLVIDGFIAYGVRALLVMRDAPLRARAYCWTLFGAATTASLWANALHAVRLNQQSAAAGGLRLGDTVVAVLSTIAPLALAGAVHLYILIARGPVTQADQHGCGDLGQVTASVDRGQRMTALAGGADSEQVTVGQPVAAVTDGGDRPRLTVVQPVTVTDPADLGGQPDNARPVTDRPAEDTSATDPSVSPVTAPPVTDRADPESGGRSADRDIEELLEIANKAVEEANNKVTRQIVAQAIRGQKRTLSSDTLTQLMPQLRELQRQRQLAAANRD
ncbi:DUF2637 domain-containing protein [Kitasatospora sp. NPDC050463]|uniref:DUF2637 domain-containing protein n=1 Tax=Kitasatospora sp. NPDC050463 TaxID=3155786 RepID=UPI0033D3EC20